jgi:succinate dehydrogenase hydrophobic anchor subunit
MVPAGEATMSMSEEEGEVAGNRFAGPARLTIGLLQGLAIYGLTRVAAHNPDFNHSAFYAALSTALVLAPLVVLAEIRRLPWKILTVWTLVVALVTGGIGAWTVLRDPETANPIVSWLNSAIFFSAILLFISHHLVVTGIAARRWIAPFPDYFDTAWRHGVQLVLCGAFLGIFWLLIFLGVAMFKLIGLDFLETLVSKPWFFMPVSSMVYAGAIHLTDVRAGLVRGIRTVILTLFGFLLPLIAGLSAAFLVAVLFTGMHALWATKSTAGTLLAVAAALIIFMNAVYQDGAPDRAPPPVLRWTLRLAPFLLLALIPLAGYSVISRVVQHGWTPSRVVAVTCFIVGFAYMGGYVLATLTPGRPMARLEITNVLTAVVTVTAMLALLSPVADPSRISVNSQVSALKSGRVATDKFDFGFLSQRSGRFGRDALSDLTRSPNADIVRLAKRAQLPLVGGQATPSLTDDEIKAHIELYPKGAVLAPSFLKLVREQKSGSLFPTCLLGTGNCVAYFVDLNHDGHQDMVVAQFNGLSAFQSVGPDNWIYLGRVGQEFCSGVEDALRKGKVKPAAPVIDDLDVDGVTMHFKGIEAVCVTTTERANQANQAKRAKP